MSKKNKIRRDAFGNILNIGDRVLFPLGNISGDIRKIIGLNGDKRATIEGGYSRPYDIIAKEIINRG